MSAVASIWAAATGKSSRGFESTYGTTVEVARLATYSDAELRAAAGALTGGPERALPLDAWLERLQGRDEESVRVRTQAQRIEDKVLAVERSQYGLPGFTAATLAEAIRRLRERNADFIRLAQRRPRGARWHAAPSPRDRYAPVIEADDAELAVVAILSATRAQQWQFSKSKAHNGGMIFTHDRHGFAPEKDRTYVAGLSDVIDTVSRVIDSHRGPDGGRVYITRSTVRCAECNWVVAAIEVPYTSQPKPVGLCTALAVRKATQRRRY